MFSFIGVNSSGKRYAIALCVCMYVGLMHMGCEYIALGLR